ncbi:FtsW/RodA/SpoVE family cell cycle protein [Orientia tsutsugamushi]|uniref:Probable peptidoglycan glycosyltransferase FtsW n=2 Tax=Orientia tsutsugamushi TaxID=784 RepID=B3CRE8_ORITI|nr:putative peptidoglycan glycosyltransferase FtsW [Orientia tsutsugamushi]KJV54752.1 cell cycle family protein [Orientia tsutsugamushi str. Kato PP]BAG40132.1 cell division protein FtsW [Orientia tsutsugamushi str. Ikeda]SPR09135.1 cell division protein FtsW [Orientia tsutsugamushi]
MNYNSTEKFRILWRWWKSIDQYTVFLLCILSALSLMLVTTSGAAVANRIGVPQSYFASKHIFYVVLAVGTTFVVSFLNKTTIKRLAILGFILNIILLIFIKFYGNPIKGAKRWINIGGISLQPSEFVKPFFLVITGWLLSAIQSNEIRFIVTIILYLIVALLLITQPDFGMLITISVAFGIQLFIAGIPLLWLLILICISIAGTAGAYSLLPHVKRRINSFLDPTNSENYQVMKSLQAFKNGGLYGKGPGEGLVKHMLPDSHTDFIFAVAGEELGAIVCLIIVAIFTFIVIYGFIKLLFEEDNYTIFVSSGILSQFGFQAIVNMCVSTNLLPTKGMTLPFISYGGSSSVAVAIGVGILLALTRHKTDLSKYKLKI